MIPALIYARIWTHPHPDGAQRVLDEKLHHVWLGVEARLVDYVYALALEALLTLEPIVNPILLLCIPVLISPAERVRCGEDFIRRWVLAFNGHLPRKKGDATLEGGDRWP